jgi:hypothetical protein
MGIRWRGQDDNTTAVASSRWNEAADTVAERFQQLQDLPLDEAVDVALMRTPGNISREDLARRMAASRGVEPPQG